MVCRDGSLEGGRRSPFRNGYVVSAGDRRSRTVAVIGAGAGGLSAARHLLEAGHEVTLFEKGSHIGGLWVYDNDNGLSVAYDSLHINSEPTTTAFRGYPFKPGTPLFPSHREVAAYLEDFAHAFDLRRRIRFNTKVQDVRPADSTLGRGWVLTLDQGHTETFDEVVVASGHQGIPADPDWSARFAGQYLHSHAYRAPEPFAGKRVLVVGVGNSGLDIAADLAPFAEKVYSSARSPLLIMPRMMFGVPSARVMARLIRPWMPWPVQRQIMRGLSRIYHGRMEDWGFRTPRTRTHPASNATYMSHVAYGKIIVEPGIREVHDFSVTFTNGDVIEVDTIIAATGYLVDLPFLHGDLAPLRGRRLEAYRRVVHPDWPGLYFVGFFNVSGGANIAMMDVQSQFLTAVVSGTLTLPSPSEMKADTAEEFDLMAHRYPGSERYGLELEPFRYRRLVAEELNGKKGAK